MKKFLVIFLSLLLSIALVGCGGSEPGTGQKPKEEEKENEVMLQELIEKQGISFAEGDSISNVTQNITFKNIEMSGITISWKSDNDAITSEGVVTRGKEDVTVVLTVTLDGLDQEPVSKKFTLVVKQKLLSQVGKIVEDIKNLKFENSPEFYKQVLKILDDVKKLSLTEKAQITNIKKLMGLIKQYKDANPEAATNVEEIIEKIKNLKFENTTAFYIKAVKIINDVRNLSDEDKAKVTNYKELIKLVKQFTGSNPGTKKTPEQVIEEIKELKFENNKEFYVKVLGLMNDIKNLGVLDAKKVVNIDKLKQLINEYKAANPAPKLTVAQLKAKIADLKFENSIEFFIEASKIAGSLTKLSNFDKIKMVTSSKKVASLLKAYKDSNSGPKLTVEEIKAKIDALVFENSQKFYVQMQNILSSIRKLDVSEKDKITNMEKLNNLLLQYKNNN